MTEKNSGIVLVTGGFGYLGGRIASALAEDPAILPRVSTRRDVPLPAWLSRGEVVRWGPADPGDSAAAAVRGVRAVVHLAGANEIESARDPAAALESTAGGTRRLLEAAIAEGVGKFVYFSTIHVYGSPLPALMTEETPPRATHPYATTHLAAEDLVLAARRAGRIDGIVVRLSNGFGAPAHPGIDRWSLIVNDLSRQAVTDRRLVLRSSGLQRRDLIGMRDVCAATRLLLGLERSATGEGLFNVGAGFAPRMIDVAEAVAARCGIVLGYTPPIERPMPAPGEASPPLEFRFDRLRALGFAPSARLEDEIDETLRFCDAHARELAMSASSAPAQGKA